MNTKIRQTILASASFALMTTGSLSANVSTLSGLLSGTDQNNSPNDGAAGQDQSFSDNGAIYGFDASESGGFRFWDGFTTSSETATAFGANTVGPANELKSITGGGNGDDVYGVYFNSEEAIRFSAGKATVDSIDITNTTYTYYSLLYAATGWDDTNDIPTSGFVSKYADDTYLDDYANSDDLSAFEDGDYLEVTAIGSLDGTEIGTTSFRMAEWSGGVGGSFQIVNSWETWNFNFGGEIDKLEFSLAGTDTGTFGLNTPAYFAFDNLTFAPVPETASFAMLLALCSLFTISLRRNRS